MKELKKMYNELGISDKVYDLSAGIVRVPFRLLKFCLTTFFIARY